MPDGNRDSIASKAALLSSLEQHLEKAREAATEAEDPNEALTEIRKAENLLEENGGILQE